MSKFIVVFSVLFGFLSMNSVMASDFATNSGKQKVGLVSASGAYSLDDLTEKLSQKASEQGASSFKVISTVGQNKLYGVAEIYK